LWGIFQLRAARARARAHGHIGEVVSIRAGMDEHGGRIDEELARHALSPSLAKPRATGHRKHKDPAVDAVVRALRELGPDDPGNQP
jgi:hypothetical protein